MIFEKIRERLQEKKQSIEQNMFGNEDDMVYLSEAIDIINQVEAEYNQTVTNADRIRQMTDEELAEFLFEVEYRRSVFGNGAKWKSEEDALKYLQEEVEG